MTCGKKKSCTAAKQSNQSRITSATYGKDSDEDAGFSCPEYTNNPIITAAE
jgi:hypothetical protein